MRVVQGTAIDFINFFHGKHSYESVAILILTTQEKDLKLISSLIDGVTELDQALGDEVGLFLFSNVKTSALVAYDEGHHFIAGERVEFGIKTQRASDFFENCDPASYGGHFYPAIQNAVARSSISMVPDFCRAFAIDDTVLPCVCILIKGTDKVVIWRLEENLSIESIIRMAVIVGENIRQTKQRIGFAISGIEGLQDWLSAAQTSDQRIKLYTSKIVNYAVGLEHKYQVTLVPQIKAMLATGNLSSEDFDRLITNASGDNSEKIKNDSRARGLKSKLSELRKEKQHLIDFISLNDITRFQRIKDFAESLAVEIEHSSATMALESSFIKQYATYSAWIAKLGRVISTLRRVVDFLASHGGH